MEFLIDQNLGKCGWYYLWSWLFLMSFVTYGTICVLDIYIFLSLTVLRLVNLRALALDIRDGRLIMLFMHCHWEVSHLWKDVNRRYVCCWVAVQWPQILFACESISGKYLAEKLALAIKNKSKSFLLCSTLCFFL